MSPRHSQQHLQDLVKQLCTLSTETTWVEFKHNNSDPEMIGETMSALSNSAALEDKQQAYFVWGVEDETHSIVGTTFSFKRKKVGNEELENWLNRILEPNIMFYVHEFLLEDKPIVLLEIDCATHRPVRFKNEAFIRVGSYKKPLNKHPEIERALWRHFNRTAFEDGIARALVNTADVLHLLDHEAYFRFLELPTPTKDNAILEALQSDELIQQDDAGGWQITNLGAILLARNLNDFKALRRKCLRVVFYRDNDRLTSQREKEFTRGYASDFENIISFLEDALPSNELIRHALRENVPIYPKLALRELIANAIIHQDFFIKGTGPIVEIFRNRLEITNPGRSLVDTERFLDMPPKSRNESLASLMRRFRICEERGSGIDKVVFQTEYYQLPAPKFDVVDDNTKSTLFTPQTLTRMDKADRIRACYLHACLKHVQSEYLTNSSIRERFDIEDHNSASASRLIKEALDAEVIIAHDPTAANKLMKYMPWWAAGI